VRKPTSDLTVYDLHLRAMPGLYARSRAGYESAKSLLEEAVARDSNFAQVRGMLRFFCCSATSWDSGLTERLVCDAAIALDQHVLA
jgi:hypothetical protein